LNRGSLSYTELPYVIYNIAGQCNLLEWIAYSCGPFTTRVSAVSVVDYESKAKGICIYELRYLPSSNSASMALLASKEATRVDNAVVAVEKSVRRLMRCDPHAGTQFNLFQKPPASGS